MLKTEKYKFKVGFEELHEDINLNMHINFGINRGYLELEDMKIIAPQIKNVRDGKRLMIELARKKEQIDDFGQAGFYYRVAEFFTSFDDKDKGDNYKKFQDLFYQDKFNSKILRYAVPYDGASMHALKIPAALKPSKGVIVFFGGGDSCIEDFLNQLYYLADHGYDVIGFDGPGQGNMINVHGYPFRYDWESPVSAVLDYFNLDAVTLIGASFGGWLCLRAAAFDSRITRVIPYDIYYDYWSTCLFKDKPILSKLIRFLLRLRLHWILDKLFEKKRKTNVEMNWYFSFLTYVNGVSSISEYFEKSLFLTPHNLHCDQIYADVFLLAGENDHLIPLKLLKKQEKLLINAKSLSHRIFREDENADQHCQTNNFKLALDEIIRWLDITDSPS